MRKHLGNTSLETVGTRALGTSAGTISMEHHCGVGAAASATLIPRWRRVAHPPPARGQPSGRRPPARSDDADRRRPGRPPPARNSARSTVSPKRTNSQTTLAWQCPQWGPPSRQEPQTGPQSPVWSPRWDLPSGESPPSGPPGALVTGGSSLGTPAWGPQVGLAFWATCGAAVACGPAPSAARGGRGSASGWPAWRAPPGRASAVGPGPGPPRAWGARLGGHDAPAVMAAQPGPQPGAAPAGPTAQALVGPPGPP